MADVSRRGVALGRILELVVLVNRDMTQSLARDGLTGPRAHVLWELQQRGPLTQRSLADALSVSARNVTGLIDGLTASGFVTREAHPTDRRATLVTFTERGAATAAALDRGQEEFARILFEGMPDEQVDSLVDTVGELLARLRPHVPENA